MRTKPYTEIGLKRMKCASCGKQACEQWTVNVCSSAVMKGYTPVCKDCDIKLNKHTLDFFRIENREQILKGYIKNHFV